MAATPRSMSVAAPASSTPDALSARLAGYALAALGLTAAAASNAQAVVVEVAGPGTLAVDQTFDVLLNGQTEFQITRTYEVVKVADPVKYGDVIRATAAAGNQWTGVDPTPGSVVGSVGPDSNWIVPLNPSTLANDTGYIPGGPFIGAKDEQFLGVRVNEGGLWYYGYIGLRNLTGNAGDTEITRYAFETEADTAVVLPAPIPEPTMGLMTLAGGLGLIASVRQRRRDAR